MVRKNIQKALPKIPKVGDIATPLQKRRAAASLRTSKEEVRYERAKKAGKAGRPFLEEPRLREWKYWAMIPNEFPYSAAFKVHHMLIPVRVVAQADLSAAEKRELQEITEQISKEGEYDCTLTNFPRNQSNKSHFHVHFLTFKDRRKHLRF